MVHLQEKFKNVRMFILPIKISVDNKLKIIVNGK